MHNHALITACTPVIPSADLEISLRFWVNGLGFNAEREMRHEGRLIGCMVYNGHSRFWLNQRAGTPVKPEDYEGIRLYWTPTDITEAWEHLKKLGYPVSEIVDREYGQTEFFVTDEDGYDHCFGCATKESPVNEE